MRWAFLFFSLLVGSAQAQDQGAVNPDAVALRLGGFPLLDPDARLDPTMQAALTQRQDALAACCDLDLVILVQNRSRTGVIENDLGALRSQIRRAGLWTPQTLLLVYQGNPAAVVVARGAEAGDHTGLITSQILSALADDPRGVRALPPFLANLENDVKAQMAAAAQPALTPWQQRALAHIGLSLSLGLAGWILLSGYNRTSGRAAAARQVDMIPDHPLIRFAFPARPLHALKGQMQGPKADMVLLKPWQGMRHRGLALASAVLASLLLGLGVNEVPGVPFLTPSFLGIGLGLLVFFGMLFTPLGAWLTPPSWRHRVLRIWLAQQALRNGRPCLILLHRGGRLTLWQPRTLPIRPALILGPAQRLAGEAAHGSANTGLKAFIDQFQRLARTYI